MIVGRTVWTQSMSVRDRQTDGRTDRRIDRITITNTVQRRASHGKNYTCHPTKMNAPRLSPNLQAGIQFRYLGGMEG